MMHIQHTALLVRDFDEAIRFFVDALGFELVTDAATYAGEGNRWVTVRPPGAATGLVLARADGEEQEATIGKQFAGRVGLFLWVDDFDAAYLRLLQRGVTVFGEPRDEPYGRVVVFADIAGNRWDLLGPLASADDTDRSYYHGTRADLQVGTLLAPGFESNYGSRRTANHIYFSALVDTAVWGAELAAGDGRERIYIVEPTGDFEDDPNVTNKRFPGNPTKSYRSRQPLRVVGEVGEWAPHAPEILQAMKDNVARLAAQGIEAIDD